MLLGPDGNPLEAPPREVVDARDGYRPDRMDAMPDWKDDPAVLEAAAAQAHREAVDAVSAGRMDSSTASQWAQARVDSFRNELTGIGDWLRDKTFGGNPNGPPIEVRHVTGQEAEDLWRGSALGERIVETLPAEMTRRWVKLSVQLDEAESAAARRDAAAPAGPASAAPLPKHDNTGVELAEEVRKLLVEELDAPTAFREALCYVRAYGGGAIFLNVEDGESDLTKPLDISKVRGLNGITPIRGGWDGELIAWSWYSDMLKPKYGRPRIWMFRNYGVPLSSPPAPGEARPAPLPTPGPTGAQVHFIHESRLLIFRPRRKSRRAEVQMRGWGDSIFTRVLKALRDFDMTWGGLAILMQEWSVLLIKMENLAAHLAGNSKNRMNLIADRARAMQMGMSIARTRFVDSKEDVQRLSVTMAGVKDVLDQFWLLLAAVSNLPVSLLTGQVQSGLGDASAGDREFLKEQVAAAQEFELLPQARALIRLILQMPGGPTGGREPRKWAVSALPLHEESRREKAEIAKIIAETDQIYYNLGAASSSEIAITRFSGAEANDGPIQIDYEGRAAMARAAELEGPDEPDEPPDDAPPAPGTPATPAAPAPPASPPKPAGDAPPPPPGNAAGG